MEGDNRAEKYMHKVKDELERSGLTGQPHISVYNRCYEAVMNVLRESDTLKNALRHVSPWVAEGGSYECESCGQLIVDEPTCAFCENKLSQGHKDDCEYKRLTAQ